MGLFLPSEKSSISTTDFLREVREKTVWVPELAKMSFRACVNPPSNASLSVSIQEMIANADYNGDKDGEARYKRLALYLGRYSADQQFLLGICATLSPEMCIFQRDYKPPQARKPEQMGMPFVSNADKFLDGLPTLSAKE